MWPLSWQRRPRLLQPIAGTEASEVRNGRSGDERMGGSGSFLVEDFAADVWPKFLQLVAQAVIKD